MSECFFFPEEMYPYYQINSLKHFLHTSTFAEYCIYQCIDVLLYFLNLFYTSQQQDMQIRVNLSFQQLVLFGLYFEERAEVLFWVSARGPCSLMLWQGHFWKPLCAKTFWMNPLKNPRVHLCAQSDWQWQLHFCWFDFLGAFSLIFAIKGMATKDRECNWFKNGFLKKSISFWIWSLFCFPYPGFSGTEIILFAIYDFPSTDCPLLTVRLGSILTDRRYVEMDIWQNRIIPLTSKCE